MWTIVRRHVNLFGNTVFIRV